MSSTNSASSILRNSIFSNGGLGIELYGPGENSDTDVVAADDADIDPNGLQNKPTLISALTSNGTTTVEGVLDTKPDTTFTVRFFSQKSGDEGKKFIG